jgi:hypothetical protein
MHNYTVFFASWDLSLFHLSLIVYLMPVKSSALRSQREEKIFRGVREEVDERQLQQRSLQARVPRLLVLEGVCDF